MAGRVLYVQFADPAAYPPVEHSSHILADKGWDVVLLGTDAFGSDDMVLSQHPRIAKKNIPLRNTGWLLKAQYIFFSVWCFYWVARWRPAWVYASDPLAAPTAWLLRKLSRVRIIYHEHDAPNPDHNGSPVMAALRGFRAKLGRDAEICVIPQRERLAEFIRATGRKRQTICVWNCPRLHELEGVERKSASKDERHLVVYYHGSINPQRVPFEFVAAAARFKGAVTLRIAGYEAPGNENCVSELMEFAAENGAPAIVEFLGIISPHEALLKSAAQADIGLSLMPLKPNDVNLRYMVGASNKSFDYMASGLPLLVTENTDWVETFVKPGYARACDPADVDSIERQLAWFLDHPKERRIMGERCADKIRSDWNYEAMFSDVVAALERV